MVIHAHFASRDLPAVGTKSRVLLALLPPSRARASPFPFRGGVSSGSRGGLCAMLEGPKFVPMARPYASYTPISYIYIYIYQSWPLTQDARSQHRLPYMETILQVCYTCVGPPPSRFGSLTNWKDYCKFHRIRGI